MFWTSHNATARICHNIVVISNLLPPSSATSLEVLVLLNAGRGNFDKIDHVVLPTFLRCDNLQLMLH